MSISKKFARNGDVIPRRANAAQAAIGALAPGLKVLLGIGHNGVGACAFPSVLVGDSIKAVINLSDLTDVKAGFEATATVTDQLQQTGATDYSAKKLLVVANNTVDQTALKTLVNELRAALVYDGLIKGSA